MLRSIITILLFTSSLIAQVDTDTIQLQSKIINDSLFLHVQRPDKDTLRTFASHYRMAACTRPDAKAFINGKPSKVYASGAFVELLKINVDTNTFRFTVKSPAGDSLWKEFVIIRPRPMRNSPHDTLVIEQAMMEPAEDMWLTSGDILEVKFKGSPGWEASFDIPDVESGIPMRECSPGEGGGFTGVYIGRYIIQPTDEARDVQIKFHLKKSFWSSEKISSKGKISLLPKELPRVGEIVGKRPYLNAGLGEDRLGGSKLGFLQEGIRVVITGKVGTQYRVKLSASMEAWLPEGFAKLLPPEEPLPHALAGSLSATSEGSEEIVTLALSEKLPYSSELLVNPNAIAVDIYGATSNTNWISQSRFVKGIESITWKQVAADQYRILIGLLHPHWGYDIEYARQSLRIKIRKPPVIASPDSVLAGLVIAVDAGHGGENNGAIGATGALEKDMNISMARHLETILVSKGAQVLLTRTEDNIPTMVERVEKIVRSGARLLVCIHCNSAGDASDPLALRGVSTYYRPLGFKPLADMIYDNMLSLKLKPFGEVGSFNFTLNALTQLPNVLVETAFLSHPEDEMLLMDDGFRANVAEQIAKGLKNFVRTYSGTTLTDK